MTPIHVRVPRGSHGLDLTASWHAGQVTCVVGPDGPRRDAVLGLLAALLELPHRLREVDPVLRQIAPDTFAAHEAGRMLGRELSGTVTWRNPARAGWGGASLSLWGIGCDYVPPDPGAPRGVLCSTGGDLFLGSWERPLVGILSQVLLLAPGADSWTTATRDLVVRHAEAGGQVLVSGRQVPSFFRYFPDLREVLVPSRDRVAVVR